MQKVFWTQGAKVSEKSFAPPKTAFAPVQNGVWVVQKTFRRPLLPGSKRPFAPSPKHFWEFSLFGQFPRPVASQFPGFELRPLEDPNWEEPSIGECQSWDRRLTTLMGHWSIQLLPENKASRDWSMRISLEIHMDHWLPNL